MNQTASRSVPGQVKANAVALACGSFGEVSAQPLLLIMGLGCRMPAARCQLLATIADHAV